MSLSYTLDNVGLDEFQRRTAECICMAMAGLTALKIPYSLIKIEITPQFNCVKVVSYEDKAGYIISWVIDQGELKATATPLKAVDFYRETTL